MGGVRVAVTGMVTTPGPQSKVTMPPLPTAVCSAAKVQLADVPFPTTVVGWLVSTGRASAGRGSVVHDPLGFPAMGSEPASEPVVPLELPVPLPELDAPPELDVLPEPDVLPE